MNMLLGLGTWVAALLFVPAPLIARILLVAPLTVVPRLLGTSARGASWSNAPSGRLTLGAAVLLPIAFSLPPGALAGLVAIPWLLLGGLTALVGLVHATRNPRAAFSMDGVPRLGEDAAMGFLGVGALFVMLDRLGIQPLGFSSTIILLTAVHFHFAGFGLLTIASRAARTRPIAALAVAALVVGVPLTALGFVLGSHVVNAFGSVVVAGGGLGTAAVLLTGRRRDAGRWADRVAGIALLVAMPLAIGWAVAIVFSLGFLDLDVMVRTHGALNAGAVFLVAAAAYPTGSA